jgi:hypothetical protein
MYMWICVYIYVCMYVCMCVRVLDYTLNKKKLTGKDMDAPAIARVLYSRHSGYLTLATYVTTTDGHVHLN